MLPLRPPTHKIDGVGVFIALLHFGSMPHELAMKNIRLFAEKVLPELKR